MEAYWGESNEGARRKYYRITNDGRKLLEEKMKDWNEIHRLVTLCYEGGE
ncbi:helix-turn-helix transcriptional regulator [Brevibacillus laterosporus]